MIPEVEIVSPPGEDTKPPAEAQPPAVISEVQIVAPSGEDAKPPAEARPPLIDTVASRVPNMSVSFADLMLETDLPKRLAMFDALTELQQVSVLWPYSTKPLPSRQVYPANWGDKFAKAVVTVDPVPPVSAELKEVFLKHYIRGLPMFTYGFHVADKESGYCFCPCDRHGPAHSTVAGRWRTLCDLETTLEGYPCVSKKRSHTIQKKRGNISSM